MYRAAAAALFAMGVALACASPIPPARAKAPASPAPPADRSLLAPAVVPTPEAAQPAERCEQPAAGAASALTRYPAGQLYSPMSAGVVARLSALLAGSKGRRNVFIKVGDSITISNHFLKCFAHGPIDLGRHSHLEETRRFFNQELLGPPKTSFDRASLANRVGWTAVDPRRGSPSPLDLETTGTRPAFAVVMFGSNGSALHAINTFQQDLLGTIDYLLARGIIPLMSTVPPKLGKPESMAAIPEMNAIVRAIAQARQVPFMDYFAALQHLPEYGLSKDGVHPRPHLDGFEARGCWLNDEALTASMNVRNLLVLTSLDRVRRFLLAGAPPEQQPPALAGRGSPDCPFEVDQLPFVDAAQTSQLVAPPLPCAQADTSGPVTVYALKLQQRTRLRARLFSDPGAKLRLLLTRSGPSPACLSSADRDIETFAEPGEYRLVVAAAVEQGRPRPGSYRLTLVAVE